jgi:hypothetical protein
MLHEKDLLGVIITKRVSRFVVIVPCEFGFSIATENSGIHWAYPSSFCYSCCDWYICTS